MDKFVDTFEDNAWMCEKAHREAVLAARMAEQDGYVKVPDWFPVPLPGYEYKIFGQMITLMKPKPKLRHILRYKFKPHWIRAWRAKRFVRKMFQA